MVRSGNCRKKRLELGVRLTMRGSLPNHQSNDLITYCLRKSMSLLLYFYRRLIEQTHLSDLFYLFWIYLLFVFIGCQANIFLRK